MLVSNWVEERYYKMLICQSILGSSSLFLDQMELGKALYSNYCLAYSSLRMVLCACWEIRHVVVIKRSVMLHSIASLRLIWHCVRVISLALGWMDIAGVRAGPVVSAIC